MITGLIRSKLRAKTQTWPELHSSLPNASLSFIFFLLFFFSPFPTFFFPFLHLPPFSVEGSLGPGQKPLPSSSAPPRPQPEPHRSAPGGHRWGGSGPQRSSGGSMKLPVNLKSGTAPAPCPGVRSPQALGARRAAPWHGSSSLPAAPDAGGTGALGAVRAF